MPKRSQRPLACLIKDKNNYYVSRPAIGFDLFIVAFTETQSHARVTRGSISGRYVTVAALSLDRQLS